MQELTGLNEISEGEEDEDESSVDNKSLSKKSKSGGTDKKS